MIIEGTPLWLADTNCYVVAREEGGEAVVIDAPPDPEGIEALLDAHGLTPVALLATHGHIDHVGGVSGVTARHPMPVYVHEADLPALENPAAFTGPLGRALRGLRLDPPEVVELTADGDTIEVAGLAFTAVHTPGHTPGHICYLLEVGNGEDVLFSGDHLFAGSVGRTDLPGGSWDVLLKSMRDKILTLDDDVVVAPGHGPATTIGRERATNPFLAEAGAGARGRGVP